MCYIAEKNPNKQTNQKNIGIRCFQHHDLLEMAGTNTLLIQRLRLMTLTVLKSLNSLNPPCLNGIITPQNMYAILIARLKYYRPTEAQNYYIRISVILLCRCQAVEWIA